LRAATRVGRLLTLVLLAGVAGGCYPRTYYHFDYELRVRQTVDVPQDTWASLATRGSIGSSALGGLTKRFEGEWVIFSNDWEVVRSGDERYALVVGYREGGAAQVFVLPFPDELKPGHWTGWRKPDYLEQQKSQPAAWSFMWGLPAERSSNIPADAFELRWRLTQWEQLRPPLTDP
jgi:hypothetical protein